MSFAQELRMAADPLWRQEREHPFVTGLATGRLPLEKFRFYMCQDYVYLISYSRVFALAAAKAESLASMGRFAQLLYATLHEEMALHRQYAAQFGILEEELERTEPAPTTRAYANHLLQAAYGGGLAHIVAAILPCQWGYHEIGLALCQTPDWEKSPYAEWIRTYSSAEFGNLAAMLRRELDRLAAGLGAEGRGELRDIFLISSRYEYLFWEMSYREEGWPL